MSNICTIWEHFFSVERVALETEPGIQVLYLQGNINLETATINLHLNAGL